MPRVLSAIAGVLIVLTPASLSAQQQVATASAGRLALRATVTIQGRALDSSNGALVNTAVRVRDARSGRIVGQSLTDKVGAYSFKGLDPGSYVVEIVSQSRTTIAATSLISANAGETVTAVVKLTFNPSNLANILGHVPRSSPGSSTLAEIAAVVPAGTPVSER